MTSKDDYIMTNNSYINTYLNTNINTNMATYFLYNMNYTQPYILSNAIVPNVITPSNAIVPNVITLSNQLAPILNPDTTASATDNADIDIIPNNEYNDINQPLFNHIYDIVLTNNQYAQIIAFLNSIH